ncbi:MAG: thioesterase family protein [Eubacterium sp.]|nr:thioesterase family protein [Eubacterium sp.]
MLRKGLAKMMTDVVTMENTARSLGSGSLLVYGTPAMLTLVEKTAVALLEGQLENGMTSVGTNLNVDHISPTPVGGKISCAVTLREIDGKKLVFSVLVEDQNGIIGKGSHERFLVDADRFQAKADAKLYYQDDDDWDD